MCSHNVNAMIVSIIVSVEYNPQLLGLYTPEWRLRMSIDVERHRPAWVIMCEALWACIVHEKALYKNPLLEYDVWLWKYLTMKY